MHGELVNTPQTKAAAQTSSTKGAAAVKKPHDHRDLHGLYTLKRAVKVLGRRAIDKRTLAGKALAKWRGDLIADLGGAGAVSTQQLALIDFCTKSKLMLDSVDAWLLRQPSLINTRKRCLLPVVVQRQQLADGLARYLAQLGLARVAKETSFAELFNDSNETGTAAVENGRESTNREEASLSQPRNKNGTFSANEQREESEFE